MRMADAAYATPEHELDRGTLILRGALLLGSGGVLAALARPAAAADIPDGDLAYLRLLIAVELLKVDYGDRASAGAALRPPAKGFVRRVVAHDKRHYTGLAALL